MDIIFLPFANTGSPGVLPRVFYKQDYFRGVCGPAKPPERASSADEVVVVAMPFWKLARSS